MPPCDYAVDVAEVEILLGDGVVVVVVVVVVAAAVVVVYTPSLAETVVDQDVEGFGYSRV